MENKLILIYLVDGARPDVIDELLESGDLPNLQEFLVEAGTFRTASSVLPSTTGPAYLPFLTGCFPGTLNIPGIRWLDRGEFHRLKIGKNRFRSYNGLEAAWFDDDLPEERPTIYELFDRPFNIFSMISRGLPKGHDLSGMAKPFWYLYAHLTDDWQRVDSVAHFHLMRCLDQDPDFIFAVFPGVDTYSHLRHPRHEDTIRAYKYVDFSVGQVVNRLQRLGRWDDTLLILTSDHGLTATRTHLDLALFLQKRGVNTLYYPVIWKWNPQASVMISGNAFGHIYFLDHRDGAAATARDLKSALGNIWDELLTREEIDFLVWKDTEEVYEIVSSRGNAMVVRTDSKYGYIPQSGDPLRLGSIESPVDREQALRLTFESDYPDALVQIDQLFSCSRCGDLIVIAKNGHDLRRAYEWPEHHASHGSLHREHMIVPLLYNQQGWNPRPARTSDIFNTILKWAGKPTLENTDGEALC